MEAGVPLIKIVVALVCMSYSWAAAGRGPTLGSGLYGHVAVDFYPCLVWPMF